MDPLLASTAGNYFAERNKPAQTLIERVDELDCKLEGRFGINKAIIIYRQLLKEKQIVDSQLATATETRDKLLGTGAGGITAQMNWEMAHKKSSTYTDWQFTILREALTRELYTKYCKVRNKAGSRKNLNAVEQKYLQSGEQIYTMISQLQTPQQVLDYLVMVSKQVGNIPLSMKELLQYASR